MSSSMFGIEVLFGSYFFTFLIGILSVVLLYRYGTRNYDHWEKKGIPYVKPLPFIGNLLHVFNEPSHLLDQKFCKKLGPMYGYFEGHYKLLFLTDPTFFRGIFVKDFQNFNMRRDFKSGDRFFDNMLFALTGEDWKRVRSIVTPTFSTGKMKRMLSIFQDCSKSLLQNLGNAAKQGKPIDVKKLYGAYAMDIIASSAFSTKIDSHNDPENIFVKNVMEVLTHSLNLRVVLFVMAPKLMRLFGIPLFPEKPVKFFESVTSQIMEERKKTGQVRNDFLQLLMDTAKEVAEEEKRTDEEDIASNYGEVDAAQLVYKCTTKKNLSMEELVAQCVIFFMGGYETTAATLSMATCMLAHNQHVQDKLRAEVDAALKESNGELTHETMLSMKYLDNVISETLRMFPPGLRIERLTEADYKLGDTGITIDKGTIVTIPVYALHRDPKLYPDPDRFEPNRFTVEERAKRNQYAYLPFGAGPRHCVAMRFALLVMKACLAQVIANIIIKPAPNVKVPPEFTRGNQGLLSPKEVIVNLEIRKDSPVLK